MTKVDYEVEALADAYDAKRQAEIEAEYEECAQYLSCGNCGAGDAYEATEDTPIDSTFVCDVCGATSRIDHDGENLYTTLEYCRHNRSFDEDCIRCEVEGIDCPA